MAGPARSIVKKPLTGLELRNKIAKGKIVSRSQNLTPEQIKNAKAQYEKLMKIELEKNKTRKSTIIQKFKPQRTPETIFVSEIIEAINKATNKSYSKYMDLVDAKKIYAGLSKEARLGTVKSYLFETKNLLTIENQNMGYSENIKRIRAAFNALDIRPSEVLAAMSDYNVPKLRMWVLMNLEYTKAEIENATRATRIRIPDLESELKSYFKVFIESGVADFKDLKANHDYKSLVYNAIKHGYKEEFVNYLKENNNFTYSKVSIQRRKQLISQAYRISGRGY